MKNTYFVVFGIFFLGLLSFTGCAKRGTITGGPQDTIAPVLVNAYPENYTTNFNGNEIKITFNELIKVKDINKQLIIDREQSTDSIFFGFQRNVSRSSTFQTELSFMPWKTITFRVAYKFLEVKANYAGSLRQQVMIPQHRGLFNVAFASRNKKWEVDGTISVYSPMRLPDVDLPDGTRLMNERSQVVPVGLAQITRHYKNWDFYVGGENLFNFKQKNPIISANNPYDPTFDATRVWASVMGTVVYAGFRYEIKRKPVK